jgi:hypothetical protein
MSQGPHSSPIYIERVSLAKGAAVVSALALYNEAFSHFMFDGLPKVACAQRLRGDINVYFLVPTKRIADLLQELLNVPRSQFLVSSELCSLRAEGARIQGTECVLQINKFFLIEFAYSWLPSSQGDSQLKMGILPPMLLHEIASTRAIVKPLCIYLWRDVGMPRSVHSQSSLVQQLRSRVRILGLDFTILSDAAGFSTAHLRNMFSQARVVVGPHGGSLLFKIE